MDGSRRSTQRSRRAPARGNARELVSQLQRLRRDLGFSVSDRLRLRIDAPEDARVAITEYNDWVANEILAREITFGALRSVNRRA
jgi:isoleucyl-tRNA synthetase